MTTVAPTVFASPLRASSTPRRRQLFLRTPPRRRAIGPQTADAHRRLRALHRAVDTPMIEPDTPAAWRGLTGCHGACGWDRRQANAEPSPHLTWLWSAPSRPLYGPGCRTATACPPCAGRRRRDPGRVSRRVASTPALSVGHSCSTTPATGGPVAHSCDDRESVPRSPGRNLHDPESPTRCAPSSGRDPGDPSRRRRGHEGGSCAADLAEMAADFGQFAKMPERLRRTLLTGEHLSSSE